MKKIVCLILSLQLLFLKVNAQNSTIETDRFGKTHTPFSLPKKWFQSEIGLLKQTDKVPEFKLTDKYFQHPLFFARYGLTNRIEARVITEWATEKTIDTNLTDVYTGINTFQAGFKANFVKEKGIRPEIALIAHYSFNSLRTLTGKMDTIDGANFRFAFQHTLSDNVWLNYNAGMHWDYFGHEPAFIYTFSPRLKFEEKWQGFVEVFGFIWKDDAPYHTISAGLAYNVNDNFKIDAAAGIKLNKHTPDNFYTIGTSFRFRTNRVAE
jgi:hypothetical protein